MAEADQAVNGQATDAVAQANLEVIGEAPAAYEGGLRQTAGRPADMFATNAAYARQQADATYQAAESTAVKHLIGAQSKTI